MHTDGRVMRGAEFQGKGLLRDPRAVLEDAAKLADKACKIHLARALWAHWWMCLLPMPGDIDPTSEPNICMALGIVDEAFESHNPSGASYQSAM